MLAKFQDYITSVSGEENFEGALWPSWSCDLV